MAKSHSDSRSTSRPRDSIGEPQISGSGQPLWIWPEATLGRVSLMGILNVTPDSFYDGGLYHAAQSAELVQRSTVQGLKLLKEGALYLDIGGESSRPGADPVSTEEELNRVIPVIESLIAEVPHVVISVDTVKPAVAEAALNAGARIINDIRGLRDTEMRALAAQRRAGVVIMHMRGTPKTMQVGDLHSDHLVAETLDWLSAQCELAVAAGMNSSQLAVDVGIGFGKTVIQNLTLMKDLRKFKSLSPNLLVGASRKSFIGAITGATVRDRLPGSISAITESMRRGGNIFRVHDVASSRQALMIAESIRQGSNAAPPLSLDEWVRLKRG